MAELEENQWAIAERKSQVVERKKNAADKQIQKLAMKLANEMAPKVKPKAPISAKDMREAGPSGTKKAVRKKATSYAFIHFRILWSRNGWVLKKTNRWVRPSIKTVQNARESHTKPVDRQIASLRAKLRLRFRCGRRRRRLRSINFLSFLNFFSDYFSTIFFIVVKAFHVIFYLFSKIKRFQSMKRIETHV